METLACTRNSDAYHALTLHHFAAEHAHYYTLKDSSLKDRLLDIRCNHQDYVGRREHNVLYLDWLNAKRLIEVRYLINLKTVCGQMQIFYRGQRLSLIASFDGLEINMIDGIVWVHIPYTKDKHNLIAALGWEELIDQEMRMYLEHLFLVSGFQTAMLTMSDGTFVRTLSHEYESKAVDRYRLLDSYADFQEQLHDMQDARKQHKFE